MNDRLKIISTSTSKNRKEKYERKWLEQITRERILELLDRNSLQGKLVADIGCGNGFLAKTLCQWGATCDACDISLKQLPQLPNLHPIQTFLPETNLADTAYDLVLCIDTIAELNPRDYRIAMAELCRILKLQGEAILSTPIDIYSQDALERFLGLVQTEFTILDLKFSYHYLYIKLTNLLEIPKKYWKGYQNPLTNLSKIGQFWHQINSSFPLAWIWGGVQWITGFFQKIVLEHKTTLLFLESISRFFWDKQAISHVIVKCHRKPLIPPENTMLTGRPNRPPFLREKRWE